MVGIGVVWWGIAVKIIYISFFVMIYNTYMNKDWKCSGCSYHNFGKNMTCRKCHNLYSKEQERNQCINQIEINSKIPRPLDSIAMIGTV